MSEENTIRDIDKALINIVLVCLLTPSCRNYLLYKFSVIKEVMEILEKNKMVEYEGWWGE